MGRQKRVAIQGVEAFALATIILVMSAAASAAPAISFEDRDWGRVGIVPLETAPYPHESRADGFEGRSAHFPRDPHYVDSSAGFLVPNGYTPTDTVDLVVWFHGHQSELAPLIPQYFLGEQLEGSGVNAILIAPQGPKMASDSRNGKLDEPGGFTAFVEECLAALHASGVTTTETLGSVVLAGHSGGFHTVGQIISNEDLIDHVREAYLFDATYAQLENYAALAERPGTRLRSIFTAHLAEENVDLMCDLQHRGVPYVFLHDELVTDEILASEPVVFMHTDLRHLPLVFETKNLERWLRGSTLSKRP
jgi:hypothetical protein